MGWNKLWFHLAMNQPNTDFVLGPIPSKCPREIITCNQFCELYTILTKDQGLGTCSCTMCCRTTTPIIPSLQGQGLWEQ